MFNRLVYIYEQKKEVVNYIIFGGLTTIINLLTYFILTVTLLNVNNSIEIQIANVISWIVAVLFAYFTNRLYVFDSKNKNKKKELGYFFITRVATLFVDILIMYLGVNILLFNDKIVKIISQFFVIISNYILSKVFVFNNKSKCILL